MQRALLRPNDSFTSGWRDFISRLILMTAGTLIAVFGLLLFNVPAEIAPAGVAGIAVILNSLFGLPIGLVGLIGNVPILYLAYRMLGGIKAMMWTLYIVVLYSVAVDVLIVFMPEDGVTDDRLLSAVFAGVLGGLGGGLVYRSGATFGGATTLARILQEKFGMPLSSSYMYVNLLVVGAAGVFLGWESALLTLVMLMMEGMMSDYVMEGPSVIRTANIITTKPREVADAVLYGMNRGVTGWEGQGMYTGEARHVLFVTVGRPHVTRLKELVLTADPEAFIIIGHGHAAYGGGFTRQAPKA